MEHPTALYTALQAQDIDQLVGNASLLMERAGQAVFNILTEHYPEATPIVVCCGSGNNGGDGYVIARLAHQAGFKVKVYQVGHKQPHTPEAQQALAELETTGVTPLPYQGETFEKGSVLVDALLGTGIQTVLRSPYLELITAMNQSGCPIVAVDVPSGLDSSTGRVLGLVVRADITVCLLVLKQGLFTADGPDHVGKLYFDNLQVESSIAPNCIRLTDNHFKNWLPKRPKASHKGDFGHVLIIGGNLGMAGAALLAGEAALRVGAGKVSIATRENYSDILHLARPELMCHAIEKPKDLKPLLKQATVIAIGPGLGQDKWAKEIFVEILKTSHPLIVDADALNLLALKNKQRENWVLTPHPGEAARLLQISTDEIQADRFAAVKKLQQLFGGCAVLKGNGSLICDEQQKLYLCDLGNPGMASGGMGDVLTGVIAGLVAQGLSLANASQLGVYWHAQAGSLAAEQGERGTLARDLMPFLHQLVNSL